MHRFLWDMHWAPLPQVEPEFPMNAIAHNTPPEPTGPWAMPGNYSAVLTVNGKSDSQPLTLKMDPRVQASDRDLAEQFALSKQLYDARPELEKIGREFDAVNEQLTKAKERATNNPAVAPQLDAFGKKLAEFAPANPRPFAPLTFDLLAKLQNLFAQLQEADAAPRPTVKAAVAEVVRSAPQVAARWQQFTTTELPGINAQLKSAGIEEIKPMPK